MVVSDPVYIKRIDELPTPAKDREFITYAIRGADGVASDVFVLKKDATDTYVWESWATDLSGVQGDIDDHIANVANPHAVTKAQVGLGSVDNTSNVTERAAVATLTNKTLTSPVVTTPTGIVKGDVGLGSVDNTSDVNKPVSTAQGAAIGLKLDAAKVLTVTGSYDAGALAVGASDDHAFVLNGAAVNDAVIVGPPATFPADCQVSGYVPAADLAGFRITNHGVGALTPGALTWRVTVIKP